MKYMGSKARVAKEIAPIINGIITEHGISEYVEPFVGGANLIEHIHCPLKVAGDDNPYLIAFWRRLQQGWNPLEEVNMTKELYLRIKNNPERYRPELVALAGLCATYNAKWFSGFAGVIHTKAGTVRDYYNEAVRNVLKQVDRLKDVHFFCGDYQQFSDYEGALIYCDPPYQGTTGYAGGFDHPRYWDWIREMSKNNIVLCSEYVAPPDFECLWQKQLTTTLDKSSRSKAVEKLFVLRGDA